jgi:hypothetical protein
LRSATGGSRRNAAARSPAIEEMISPSEELDGSPALVKKMVFGPWDDEFLVAEPGQTIQYTDFVQSRKP